MWALTWYVYISIIKELILHHNWQIFVVLDLDLKKAAKNLDYNKPLPSLMTETLDQWYNQKDKLASTETEIEKYME